MAHTCRTLHAAAETIQRVVGSFVPLVRAGHPALERGSKRKPLYANEMGGWTAEVWLSQRKNYAGERTMGGFVDYGRR